VKRRSIQKHSSVFQPGTWQRVSPWQPDQNNQPALNCASLRFVGKPRGQTHLIAHPFSCPSHLLPCVFFVSPFPRIVSFSAVLIETANGAGGGENDLSSTNFSQLFFFSFLFFSSCSFNKRTQHSIARAPDAQIHRLWRPRRARRGRRAC
jgi:hypothetical protein